MFSTPVVMTLPPPPPPSGPHWLADTARQTGPKSFQQVVASVQHINQMLWAERVVLYASVYGRQPKRCLEIGTYRGGSASIIVAALDDVGAGTLTCVDQEPQVTQETWERLRHRATLVRGRSPDVLAQVGAEAGGRFDWVLIDGAHDYVSLVHDLHGTMPFLEDEAYILFHDAHHADVGRALDDLYALHPELTDLGMLATPRVADEQNPNIHWGGFRAARFLRRGK